MYGLCLYDSDYAPYGGRRCHPGNTAWGVALVMSDPYITALSQIIISPASLLLSQIITTFVPNHQGVTYHPLSQIIRVLPITLSNHQGCYLSPLVPNHHIVPNHQGVTYHLLCPKSSSVSNHHFASSHRVSQIKPLSQSSNQIINLSQFFPYHPVPNHHHVPNRHASQSCITSPTNQNLKIIKRKEKKKHFAFQGKRKKKSNHENDGISLCLCFSYFFFSDTEKE